MSELEQLREENARLKEENEKLQLEVMCRRSFSDSPDLQDAYDRRQKAISVDIPAVGQRVKVVNPGSKYNSKDFESSFSEFSEDFSDTVAANAMGNIVATAEHFKKQGTWVFLVRFDNKSCVAMARKGIEPTLWVGQSVGITNIRHKYTAKDFAETFPGKELVNNCNNGQKGVILQIVPHYKNSKLEVFLVAINSGGKCVVMNGKGLTPRDPPGLAPFIRQKEAEQKAAEEAAAAAATAETADAEPESEKREREDEGEEEGEIKRAKEDANE
eukprot:TRINITY_DN1120_c0_g1_i2.p1 TRINITY_DN1120_c0_g1~~TRINITY_DN1120_c0_g1_i2.p1  ORF type:complete len:272 (+),score=68.35 TRINITY_DN1120_c0_g1_i2:34-849(+)